MSNKKPEFNIIMKNMTCFKELLMDFQKLNQILLLTGVNDPLRTLNNICDREMEKEFVKNICIIYT